MASPGPSRGPPGRGQAHRVRSEGQVHLRPQRAQQQQQPFPQQRHVNQAAAASRSPASAGAARPQHVQMAAPAAVDGERGRRGMPHHLVAQPHPNQQLPGPILPSQGHHAARAAMPPPRSAGPPSSQPRPQPRHRPAGQGPPPSSSSSSQHHLQKEIREQQEELRRLMKEAAQEKEELNRSIAEHKRQMATQRSMAQQAPAPPAKNSSGYGMFVSHNAPSRPAPSRPQEHQGPVEGFSIRADSTTSPLGSRSPAVAPPRSRQGIPTSTGLREREREDVTLDYSLAKEVKNLWSLTWEDMQQKRMKKLEEKLMKSQKEEEIKQRQKAEKAEAAEEQRKKKKEAKEKKKQKKSDEVAIKVSPPPPPVLSITQATETTSTKSPASSIEIPPNHQTLTTSVAASTCTAPTPSPPATPQPNKERVDFFAKNTSKDIAITEDEGKRLKKKKHSSIFLLGGGGKKKSSPAPPSTPSVPVPADALTLDSKPYLSIWAPGSDAVSGPGIFKLKNKEATIGSDKACNVHVLDEGVPQLQAMIYPQDGAFMIRDLDRSMGGTKVNGQALQDGNSTFLRAGDVLAMGKTKIVVCNKQVARPSRFLPEDRASSYSSISPISTSSDQWTSNVDTSSSSSSSNNIIPQEDVVVVVDDHQAATAEAGYEEPQEDNAYYYEQSYDDNAYYYEQGGDEQNPAGYEESYEGNVYEQSYDDNAYYYEQSNGGEEQSPAAGGIKQEELSSLAATLQSLYIPSQ